MNSKKTVELIQLLGDLIDLGYICEDCDDPSDLPTNGIYTNQILNSKTSDLLDELACHIVSWSRGDGIYPLPKTSSAAKRGRLKNWEHNID